MTHYQIINESKEKSWEKLENSLRWMKTKQTFHSLWDSAEEILKCVFENIDIKREERSQIKNLTFHHNKLGSDEQTTLRASRKKGNKVESRNKWIWSQKTIEKNETKRCVL